jgi:outer membrane protein insertion porin family
MLRCRCSFRCQVFSVLVALMMAFCAQSVFAQTPRVVEIGVQGNQNINTDTIRNAISLKAGDEFTDQAVEKDKAAIMSLGYFSAVTVHRDDVPGGIKITFEVTENPRITEVKVVGSEPIPAAKILGLMKTKAGQVLNSTTLDQDIEAIIGLYREEGYIAYVTEDIGVDAKTGILTVPVLVHTVESVEITGNKKTKSFVFLREMRTKPGQVFNVKTLKEDIIRIYNLDILEEIKNYQITPGSDLGSVKIVIPVVEKKTGQISVGFGYSSKQRLVGQARLSETNFRGRGQGVNLLWEQGTSDAVGGPTSYELGFYEPWIDKHNTSLSINGYNKVLYRFSSGILNSGTISGDNPYNERHTGGDITLSRPLNRTTRAYIGGRFERVETDPSLLNQIAYANIVQTGDIAGVSLRLVHNTRDFDLDPAAGGYEAISAEYGNNINSVRYTPLAEPVPFTGGFSKFSVDVRRYFSRGGRKTSPQDKRVTLAVRFRAGTSTGNLPFFEQFFVGGGESLRGYREDRFWGNQMMLLSVELRKPIAQSISGVLFVDYGDAWNGNPDFFIASLSQGKSFSGHFGTGIGMRVSTPIGHLRLDYGIGSEGGRTHFSMGHAF